MFDQHVSAIQETFNIEEKTKTEKHTKNIETEIMKRYLKCRFV